MTVLIGQSITCVIKQIISVFWLRFEEHVQTIVTKAEQRMHIARNFVYLRTRLVIEIKSFNQSFHAADIIHNHI